jgi:hypothetical protein
MRLMKTILPVAEIVAHYQSGMTLEDLARRYQCSPGRIRRVVAASGEKIRQPGTRAGTRGGFRCSADTRHAEGTDR